MVPDIVATALLIAGAFGLGLLCSVLIELVAPVRPRRDLTDAGLTMLKMPTVQHEGPVSGWRGFGLIIQYDNDTRRPLNVMLSGHYSQEWPRSLHEARCLRWDLVNDDDHSPFDTGITVVERHLRGAACACGIYMFKQRERLSGDAVWARCESPPGAVVLDHEHGYRSSKVEIKHIIFKAKGITFSNEVAEALRSRYGVLVTVIEEE